jgi:T4 superinfection immunity protein
MSYQQPYGYPGLPLQTQVVVQSYRCSTAHVVVAWVMAVLTGFYLLPWAIAATRNRRNVAAVAMVDLFLGWTVVGWVVALVMACGSDQPAVTVHTSYAPPMLPPQPQWGQAPPPPSWAPQPQPWAEAPSPQWTQQPYGQTPALPPRIPTPEPTEPTRVDPLGAEPTRPLTPSPWEPDHRR